MGVLEGVLDRSGLAYRVKAKDGEHGRVFEFEDCPHHTDHDGHHYECSVMVKPGGGFAANCFHDDDAWHDFKALIGWGEHAPSVTAELGLSRAGTGPEYQERADGIYWLKSARDGSVAPQRLTNFTARIVRTAVTGRRRRGADDAVGPGERQRPLVDGHGRGRAVRGDELGDGESRRVGVPQSRRGPPRPDPPRDPSPVRRPAARDRARLHGLARVRRAVGLLARRRRHRRGRAGPRGAGLAERADPALPHAAAADGGGVAAGRQGQPEVAEGGPAGGHRPAVRRRLPRPARGCRL